eukprot:85121-Hanusia_phi.AAC.1
MPPPAPPSRRTSARRRRSHRMADLPPTLPLTATGAHTPACPAQEAGHGSTPGSWRPLRLPCPALAEETWAC